MTAREPEPVDLPVLVVDLGRHALPAADEPRGRGWGAALRRLFLRLMRRGAEDEPPDFRRDDISRFTRIVPPRTL